MGLRRVVVEVLKVADAIVAELGEIERNNFLFFKKKKILCLLEMN